MTNSATHSAAAMARALLLGIASGSPDGVFTPSRYSVRMRSSWHGKFVRGSHRTGPGRIRYKLCDLECDGIPSGLKAAQFAPRLLKLFRCRAHEGAPSLRLLGPETPQVLCPR